MLQIVGNKRLK